VITPQWREEKKGPRSERLVLLGKARLQFKKAGRLVANICAGWGSKLARKRTAGVVQTKEPECKESGEECKVTKSYVKNLDSQKRRGGKRKEHYQTLRMENKKTRGKKNSKRMTVHTEESRKA